jgi:hypothetical protein
VAAVYRKLKALDDTPPRDNFTVLVLFAENALDPASPNGERVRIAADEDQASRTGSWDDLTSIIHFRAVITVAFHPQARADYMDLH